MNLAPRILRVETGFIPEASRQADALDYQVYAHVPRIWRRLEEKLRLDLYLSLRAKSMSKDFDIIWAGSEKVAIPLSFLRLKKPLVVIAHHLESAPKARLARATGIAKKWAGIGYLSQESYNFLAKDLGVPEDRLFQYESAKYLRKVLPSDTPGDGPILSAGVAKRDYLTLLRALEGLPGCETELFVSSKFGDKLAGQVHHTIPDWIHFMGYLPEVELLKHYQKARFVVVPLERTNHNGAGINVVLEAAAFGKAVIATHTGGMPTFVKHGETGMLVPPSDVQALRQAIQQLWEQPVLAHQMGLAGRRYIEANYDPEVVDANIITYLNRVYTQSRAESREHSK